jgi:hypothetical protein
MDEEKKEEEKEKEKDESAEGSGGLLILATFLVILLWSCSGGKTACSRALGASRWIGAK